MQTTTPCFLSFGVHTLDVEMKWHGDATPQVVLLGSALAQGWAVWQGPHDTWLRPSLLQPVWGRFWAAAQHGVFSHHDAQQQHCRRGAGLGEVPPDDPASELDTLPCKRVLLRIQQDRVKKQGCSNDYMGYLFPIKCSAIKKWRVFPSQNATAQFVNSKMHTSSTCWLHSDIHRQPTVILFYIFARVGQSLINQPGRIWNKQAKLRESNSRAGCKYRATELVCSIWHQDFT